MKAETTVAVAEHGPSPKEELERLDGQIGELSAHIAAAQARLLSLVGEFEAKSGGSPDGARSTAHWLAWRCSMTPKAARDHVRVARGLAGLPLIASAFEKGELSYHQVAILTRVATSQNEHDLLDLARKGTASQLDRAMKAYCRFVELEEANEQHCRRYLDFYFDDDGTLVIRGRLSPDDGAMVAKALEVSRQHIGFVPPDPDDPKDPPTHGARMADALVAMSASYLQNGPGQGQDPHLVMVHVDLDALANDSYDGLCELEAGVGIAPETARRLSCDASVVSLFQSQGKTLEASRRSRAIPAAMYRALRTRDRKCRFPACDQDYFLQNHHIHHWGKGGPHHLENLSRLCRWHHRLVHEGGFGMRREGDTFTFLRPDGTPIPSAPEPAALEGDLVSINSDLGLDPGPYTITPDWYGERMDLTRTVDALISWSGGPPS
jgi:uncharacterized protein DUF222